MNYRLASVLSAAELPIAELSSARLDGELFGLGELWCPIDVRVEPATRALAIARLLPRRAIVELSSAAWIYGVAPEPAQHRVCVDTRARAVIPSSPRFQVRELRQVSEDTQLIGGISVTTPLRTAIDLTRWESSSAPALPCIVARLLRYSGHSTVDPVADGLIAHSKAEALRALGRLTATQRILDGDGEDALLGRE
ncbi:type IV toxin-antitoxin system AbiEi family antitoxin [Leifsonia sp. YAF41]|uniref:type IV toxin-antitoxin system AbiEi family antitoxin n=1 Tax=Leifsonia sp. YAF41 TaxID=3233086 RepID=UPI003F9DAF66